MLLPRKAAALAVATLVACSFAVAETVSQPEPVARVYLHPAAPATGGKSQQAATISPVQLNSILAHHFDVPGEALGLGAADRAAWDYLPDEVHSGKEAVKQLFGQAKQRTAVLITGMREQDALEIMPASLRNTHEVVSSAQVSPYNVHALLHSYGERLYSALSQASFPGFLASSSHEEGAGVSQSAARLISGINEAAMSLATVNETDEHTKSSFFDQLSSFVKHFTSEKLATSSPFHALSLDGLVDLRESRGADSSRYEEAKALLKQALDLVSQRKDDASHQIAFVLMPERDDDAQLMKRSDPLWPFRAATALTPFLKTRAEEGEVEARQEGVVGHFDSDIGSKIYSPDATIAKKPQQSDAPKQPKERDYIGKCFSSEQDLNTATANCSSHGDAYQTSKGGKKCYRCKCKATKGDKGKMTQWAGDACQKIDISKEFVLLGTTTIALIVVAFGSVLYLYYDGQQELPSVLAGISIPNK